MTHDRYFLDNVAGWILEIDKGQCLPYQGNYTAWLEHKASRLTKEEAQEKAQRRQLAVWDAGAGGRGPGGPAAEHPRSQRQAQPRAALSLEPPRPQGPRGMPAVPEVRALRPAAPGGSTQSCNGSAPRPRAAAAATSDASRSERWRPPAPPAHLRRL